MASRRDQGLAFLCGCCGGPYFREIDRERKHNRRAPFARDIKKRGKISKLHSLWHRRQVLSGIEQFLCGLLLALSINDLGTAGTFGLGLASDRAKAHRHRTLSLPPLHLDDWPLLLPSGFIHSEGSSGTRSWSQIDRGRLWLRRTGRGEPSLLADPRNERNSQSALRPARGSSGLHSVSENSTGC